MNIKNLNSNSKETFNEDIYIKLKGISGILKYYLMSEHIVFKNCGFDKKHVSFYVPKIKKDGLTKDRIKGIEDDYKFLFNKAYNEYLSFLKDGVEPSVAEYLLPLALKEDVIIKCNKKQLVNLTKSLLYGNYSSMSEFHKLGMKLKDYIKKNHSKLYKELKIDNYDLNSKWVDELYNGMDSLENKKIEDVNLVAGNYAKMDMRFSNFYLCVYYLMKKYNLSSESAMENEHRLFYEDSKFKKELVKMIASGVDIDLMNHINYHFEMSSSIAGIKELVSNGIKNISIPAINRIRYTDYYQLDIDKEKKSQYEVVQFLLNKTWMYLDYVGIENKDLVYLLLNGHTINTLLTLSGKDLVELNNIKVDNEELKKNIDKIIKIALNSLSIGDKSSNVEEEKSLVLK